MAVTTGLVVEDVAIDEQHPDPANPHRIGEDELDAVLPSANRPRAVACGHPMPVPGKDSRLDRDFNQFRLGCGRLQDLATVELARRGCRRGSPGPRV
jgi:hypothetical protein